MKNIKREVPVKNYIYLSIIIFISILLLFYFYWWYLTYEEGKLNNQIMDRYLQVINYNELEDYITENKNAFVYVSVLENQEIRDFELEFKEIILEKSLKKEILYLDLTEVYSNSKMLQNAVSKYQIQNKDISNVPCILYFKNGYLNKIFDIKSNDYSTSNLINFLEEEGIKLDD